MEAEKSQNLQSAGWRSRKANGVSSHLSPKAGEDLCPRYKTVRQKVNSVTLPFSFMQAFSELDKAFRTGEGNLFYSDLKFKC